MNQNIELKWLISSPKMNCLGEFEFDSRWWEQLLAKFYLFHLKTRGLIPKTRGNNSWSKLPEPLPLKTRGLIPKTNLPSPKNKRVNTNF
jgi:hypothetical protein